MALKAAEPVLVPQTTAIPPAPDNTTTLSAEFAAFRQELDRLRRENESMKADMAERGIRGPDLQFPKPVTGKTVLVRAVQEGGFYPHVTPDGTKTHSGCGMGFPRKLGEVFLCLEKEVSKRGHGNPGWMEIYIPNVTKPMPAEAPLTTAPNLTQNPMTGGQVQMGTGLTPN